MSIFASLALRILGPKIMEAVPWRLLAILALLLGIASTYWAAERHGEAVQKASDAHELKLTQDDLHTSEANADKLKSALAIQNATIEQMAAAGKVAHAGVATAVLKGTQARQATSGVSGRLDAVSRPVAGKAAVVGDNLTDDEQAAWSTVK